MSCQTDDLSIAELAQQRDITFSDRFSKISFSCEPFSIGHEIAGSCVLGNFFAENDTILLFRFSRAPCVRHDHRNYFVKEKSEQDEETGVEGYLEYEGKTAEPWRTFRWLGCSEKTFEPFQKLLQPARRRAFLFWFGLLIFFAAQDLGKLLLIFVLGTRCGGR